jgi:hypothetical protein
MLDSFENVNEHSGSRNAGNFLSSFIPVNTQVH